MAKNIDAPPIAKFWSGLMARQSEIYAQHGGQQMIILNIGCGPELIDGVINLDINPDFNPQVVHDLEVTPLPFEDASVHGIRASHIMEHITNYPALIKDLHRILFPGGVLEMVVPYYLSEDAWGDPTHVRAFSNLSFIPVFWPGWTVDEVSLVDMLHLYANYTVRQIRVKLIKQGFKEEGATDGTTTNTDN